MVASSFLVLGGSWFAVMELILRHPGFLIRGAVAVLVVTQGALTLRYMMRPAPALRSTIIAGSLGALALGSSAVFTELHAIHFEGYILLLGVGLIAQGLLTLTCTRSTAWRSAAPRSF